MTTDAHHDCFGGVFDRDWEPPVVRAQPKPRTKPKHQKGLGNGSRRKPVHGIKRLGEPDEKPQMGDNIPGD